MTVKAHAKAAEAAESENKVMTREVKRLCREVERFKCRAVELEAELMSRPDHTRMRIKMLCLKYHPEKNGSGTTYDNSETARDLTVRLTGSGF